MHLIADYLAVRRAVGFKLRPTESRLRSFARNALEHGDTCIRSETAVAWAGAAASPGERRCRLRTVVLFARHLRAECCRASWMMGFRSEWMMAIAGV